MDSHKGIVRLIIETAKERCEALTNELQRAREKQYPSNGPRILIELIVGINGAVLEKLRSEEKNEEMFELLTARQITLRVNRYCKLIPYLHDLLGFAEGAEVKDTPASFVASISRLVQDHLPNSQLVLASKTELNYSVVQIAKGINNVLSVAGLKVEQKVPARFLVITFPRVEAGNILLHCVIAHEVGHGLFQMNEALRELEPLIKIDDDAPKISKLASRLFEAELKATLGEEGTGQLPLYSSEVQIRSSITSFVNNAIRNWIEELSSDAIGLALFGPAYFFSMIHLAIGFQTIDNASQSHPPNSLRFHLMLLMLGALGESDASMGLLDNLPAPLKSFVENWKSVSSPQTSLGGVYEVPIEAVTNLLEPIAKLAHRIVGERAFRAEKQEEIDRLCELIVNGIPPNELVDFKSESFTYPDMITILNAGWQVLLGRIEEFAKLLGKSHIAERSYCRTKLNEVILKAVELDNIRRMWRPENA